MLSINLDDTVSTVSTIACSAKNKNPVRNYTECLSSCGVTLGQPAVERNVTVNYFCK